jgi:serine/threonine-protein kinase HipA
VPSGRIPTTHIFKPGAPELAGHAHNEHFCLTLAREIGLPAASSRIACFEDQLAIIVERYDRLRHGRVVRRVHQEDCCQALSVLPVDKYESSGGPSAAAIVGLLRERSRNAAEDIATFVAALGFQWLIAGTDAHAKNYSVLIGRGGEIRLAPLYDVASYLPYAGHAIRKLKLAMEIGGKYRVHEIGAYQWKKLAAEVQLEPDAVITRINEVARELPDRAADLLRQTNASGSKHPILPKLAKGIQERARRCLM